MNQSILWRGIFQPGHEHCSVYSQASRWRLTGVAIFTYNHRPCRLEYLVECDGDWNTLAGRVSGWVGGDAVDIEIAVEGGHDWRRNGVEQPAVKSCTDVDLNFSPSTNLLPIRRLSLDLGQEAEVSAAWLRFPSFELERLDQVYRRVDETTYRYESGRGKFVAELKVNSFGLVTSYPDIWEEERA